MGRPFKVKNEIFESSTILNEVVELMLAQKFLNSKQDVKPADLRKDIEEQIGTSANALDGLPFEYTVRPSLLYPAIERLKEEGIIAGKEFYKVTPRGKEIVLSEVTRMKGLLRRILSSLIDSESGGN